MPESSTHDSNASGTHEAPRRSKNAADYPQLKELEKELVELLARKKQVDRSLANVEVMLYQFEGSYLQESAHGNIVRGFDQYLQSRPTGAAASGGTRSRHGANGAGAGGNGGRITESERIFSHSSTTYRKAVGLADEDDYTSAAAVSAHPSSPSSSDERAGLNPTSGVDGASGTRRTSSSTHARTGHNPTSGPASMVTAGDEPDDYTRGVTAGTSHRTPKRIRLSLSGRNSHGALADSDEELDV